MMDSFKPKAASHKGKAIFSTYSLFLFTLLPCLGSAQLPEPNDTGVSTGHVHLTVPDLERHTAIWTSLGARQVQAGRLNLLIFPGMIFLLVEREPTMPSRDTSVNHVGFLVQDYTDMKAKLVAAGATFVIENADAGQMLAELPDGVRIEMQQSDEINHAVEFHHIHLVAADPGKLRDWYVDLFGAEAGSRRNMPSAIVPGGRVDVMEIRDNPEPQPTRGTAIDHIGFEVADLDAFIQRLHDRNIRIDFGPVEAPALGLKVAFITDPAGTYIEITEGLDNLD